MRFAVANNSTIYLVAKSSKSQENHNSWGKKTEDAEPVFRSQVIIFYSSTSSLEKNPK